MVEIDGSEGAKKQLSWDSSSACVNETMNGSHLFRIEGYSLVKGMGVGKSITSQTFEAGGYDWVIKFYPGGADRNCSGFVSVHIVLVSTEAEAKSVYELRLLDHSGEGKHSAPKSGVHEFSRSCSKCEFDVFFRRQDLENSGYTKDDCLSIHCKVGVIRTRLEFTGKYVIPIPPSDMSQCLKGLQESGVGQDIVFHVGDESFKAHKLILAARSPVFRAQFFGLVGNPSMDKVAIEDIEPSVFKAMLHFIYTDALPGEHDLNDSTSVSLPTNMAQHLLAGADRFNLDRLKSVCESKLCEDITTENVSTTLALSEKHQSSKLKDICLKFATTPQNLGAVMKSEGFVHLKESCPSLCAELLGAVASSGIFHSSRQGSG